MDPLQLVGVIDHLAVLTGVLTTLALTVGRILREEEDREELRQIRRHVEKLPTKDRGNSP